MGDTPKTEPAVVPGLTEAMVNLMSDDALHEGVRLLREEIAKREEGAFPVAIREFLADPGDPDVVDAIRDGGGVAKITFGSGRWDDGWYYTDVAEVELGDGSTTQIDFSSTTVADQLTELSWIRRTGMGLDDSSVLVVELLTDTVTHGDA